MGIGYSEVPATGRHRCGGSRGPSAPLSILEVSTRAAGRPAGGALKSAAAGATTSEVTVLLLAIVPAEQLAMTVKQQGVLGARQCSAHPRLETRMRSAAGRAAGSGSTSE